jgi:hypothetical protein
MGLAAEEQRGRLCAFSWIKRCVMQAGSLHAMVEMLHPACNLVHMRSCTQEALMKSSSPSQLPTQLVLTPSSLPPQARLRDPDHLQVGDAVYQPPNAALTAEIVSVHLETHLTGGEFYMALLKKLSPHWVASLCHKWDHITTNHTVMVPLYTLRKLLPSVKPKPLPSMQKSSIGRGVGQGRHVTARTQFPSAQQEGPRASVPAHPTGAPRQDDALLNLSTTPTISSTTTPVTTPQVKVPGTDAHTPLFTPVPATGPDFSIRSNSLGMASPATMLDFDSTGVTQLSGPPSEPNSQSNVDAGHAPPLNPLHPNPIMDVNVLEWLSGVTRQRSDVVMATNGGITLSASDMGCLFPGQPLSSKVLDSVFALSQEHCNREGRPILFCQSGLWSQLKTRPLDQVVFFASKPEMITTAHEIVVLVGGQDVCVVPGVNQVSPATDFHFTVVVLSHLHTSKACAICYDPMGANQTVHANCRAILKWYFHVLSSHSVVMVGDDASTFGSLTLDPESFPIEMHRCPCGMQLGCPSHNQSNGVDCGMFCGQYAITRAIGMPAAFGNPQMIGLRKHCVWQLVGGKLFTGNNFSVAAAQALQCKESIDLIVNLPNSPMSVSSPQSAHRSDVSEEDFSNAIAKVKSARANRGGEMGKSATKRERKGAKGDLDLSKWNFGTCELDTCQYHLRDPNMNHWHCLQHPNLNSCPVQDGMCTYACTKTNVAVGHEQKHLKHQDEHKRVTMHRVDNSVRKRTQPKKGSFGNQRKELKATAESGEEGIVNYGVDFASLLDGTDLVNAGVLLQGIRAEQLVLLDQSELRAKIQEELTILMKSNALSPLQSAHTRSMFGFESTIGVVMRALGTKSSHIVLPDGYDPTKVLSHRQVQDSEHPECTDHILFNRDPGKLDWRGLCISSTTMRGDLPGCIVAWFEETTVVGGVSKWKLHGPHSAQGWCPCWMSYDCMDNWGLLMSHSSEDSLWVVLPSSDEDDDGIGGITPLLLGTMQAMAADVEFKQLMTLGGLEADDDVLVLCNTLIPRVLQSPRHSTGEYVEYSQLKCCPCHCQGDGDCEIVAHRGKHREYRPLKTPMIFVDNPVFKQRIVLMCKRHKHKFFSDDVALLSKNQNSGVPGLENISLPYTVRDITGTEVGDSCIIFITSLYAQCKSFVQVAQSLFAAWSAFANEAVADFRKEHGPLSESQSQMVALMIGQLETLMPGKEVFRDICLVFHQQITKPYVLRVQFAANVLDGAFQKVDYLHSTVIHVVAEHQETQDQYRDFCTNMQLLDTTTEPHDLELLGAGDKRRRAGGDNAKETTPNSKRNLLCLCPKMMVVTGETGIPLRPAIPAPGENNDFTRKVLTELSIERKSVLGQGAAPTCMASDNMGRDWLNFTETLSTNFPELVHAVWCNTGVATKEEAAAHVTKNTQDTFHSRERICRPIGTHDVDAREAKADWKSHLARVLTPNKAKLYDSEAGNRPLMSHWAWVCEKIGEEFFIALFGEEHDFWLSESFVEPKLLFEAFTCKKIEPHLSEEETVIDGTFSEASVAYLKLMFSYPSMLENADWHLVSSDVPPYPVLHRISLKFLEADEVEPLPRCQFEDLEHLKREGRRWEAFYSVRRKVSKQAGEQDILNSLFEDEQLPMLDVFEAPEEPPEGGGVSTWPKVARALNNQLKDRNLQAMVRVCSTPLMMFMGARSFMVQAAVDVDDLMMPCMCVVEPPILCISERERRQHQHVGRGVRQCWHTWNSQRDLEKL